MIYWEKLPFFFSSLSAYYFDLCLMGWLLSISNVNTINAQKQEASHNIKSNKLSGLCVYRPK